MGETALAFETRILRPDADRFVRVGLVMRRMSVAHGAMRWTVANLPPYSPEFNAAEPLRHHAPLKGTHNRYFTSAVKLVHTLMRVFRSIQQRPAQIRGYLAFV